ncbi:Ku protein [Streptomyces albus subsp. chlorinus]|uniref:non-homologous end joining protein Ku n=1 Tax=Streptomyces albus TaxID=1888 RepID=UPI00156DF5C2|nr:Ku protein [Streptomyces albus]NSC24715.1 Ku protein [Streptomyces albus subsp. chlorinus]
MARPVWSGVITFGLVTVPVRMYAATEDHTTHFHQLQRGTSDRVRNRRVNERTGKGVEYDDIVKGYEIADGEYVTVEPEELREIAPGRSQVIDVSGFVDADEVDPVYYARAYYLSPSGDQYHKPYELLRAALATSRKTGIATFVMHGKEYLVALRAGEDVLALHTLHWADEVRDPREELPELPGRERADGRELKTAQQLVESMSTPFRPEDYSDTYEERVRALVEAKADGEEVAPEEGPPQATNVVDLSEALNRSIERARSRGGGGGGPGRGRRAPSRAQRAPSRPRRGTRSARSAPKNREKAPQGGKKAAQGSGKGAKGAGTRAGGSALARLSKEELYRRAADSGVRGRSKMTREQLLEALGGSGKAA